MKDESLALESNPVTSFINKQNIIVEIFRTDVTNIEEAKRLLSVLRDDFPHCRINFDLQDCDHILRIEGNDLEVNIDSIIELVNSKGYFIELIE